MLLKAITPILLLMVCVSIPAGAYVDHRGHNVDSLETVMAAWSADNLAAAGADELKEVSQDLFDLMWGFKNANSAKSEYYARMLLGISRRMGWRDWECDAAKTVGEHFWAKERYDSAAFYYGLALSAAESIHVSEAPAEGSRTFTLEDRDDALSSIYGSLGNLYSMMDSVDVAMAYYEKAGEIFSRHDWYNSSATLYYNMGETMRYEGDMKAAEEYYCECLRYSRLSGDSLEVATANKGLGSLYMETGRTAKALRYLSEANDYFSGHEAEELQFRMESLDYTRQVLALQKKRLLLTLLLLVALALTAGAVVAVSHRLKAAALANRQLEEVLEDSVEVINRASDSAKVTLKPREIEILDLVAKGYTNIQIAGALCLSPETIKWYKKKLFAMFDASNSAELVRNAKDSGLL